MNPNHIKELATLFEVTTDYVRKVIKGKRHNKAITDAYAVLFQAETKAIAKTRKTHTKQAA